MLGMLGGAARKQKAQEAEGRHPWFQHGLLVDPRLVGRSRQEAREEKKIMSLVGSHKSVIECTPKKPKGY